MEGSEEYCRVFLYESFLIFEYKHYIRTVIWPVYMNSSETRRYGGQEDLPAANMCLTDCLPVNGVVL